MTRREFIREKRRHLKKAKQALMKGLEQAKQGKIQKNAIDIDTFDTTD